jgi:transaldolase
MRSENLGTKIFLDSGDPDETKEALRVLGFLDGQTTNPSLISKNPDTAGKKFGRGELLEFYKKTVQEISRMIPQSSVSVEVYADTGTLAEEMFRQGVEMFSWIPNAHIKYPTTAAGLKAAHMSVAEGMRVNMTLVFSQEQAAAVYAATQGAKKGDVFVSPFIGRLDDQDENGIDLIKNILRMYKNGDGHVEVLTASVRSLDHFFAAMQLESDIITSPWSVLEAWNKQGARGLGKDFAYKAEGLQSIAYKELTMEQDWRVFDISHDLTDKGIERFAADWNSLLKT